MQLYKGDLLDGWYQDWCLFERERLLQMHLAMRDALMNHYERQRAYNKAIQHGMSILSYDCAREHTHRQLIRLHYLVGNRTAALRQYDRCRIALKEELDVKPAQRTTQLYMQARNDEPIGDFLIPDTSVSSPTPGKTYASILRCALDRLKYVQRDLGYIQAQVQEEIEHIESSLKKWR